MATDPLNKAGMAHAEAKQEPIGVGLAQGELGAVMVNGSRAQILAIPVAITMRLVADSK
jgi:hypothetical protein